MRVGKTTLQYHVVHTRSLTTAIQSTLIPGLPYYTHWQMFVFLFAKHQHCAYLCGQIQTESLSQHIYIKEFDLGGAHHLPKIFSIFFRIRQMREKLPKTLKRKKRMIKIL